MRLFIVHLQKAYAKTPSISRLKVQVKTSFTGQLLNLGVLYKTQTVANRMTTEVKKVNEFSNHDDYLQLLRQIFDCVYWATSEYWCVQKAHRLLQIE